MSDIPLPAKPKAATKKKTGLRGATTAAIKIVEPEKTSLPEEEEKIQTPTSAFDILKTITSLDDKKINALLDLKYKNSDVPIIDVSRIDIIAEIAGMTRIEEFSRLYDFLSETTTPESVLWDQPAMTDSHNKLAREISIRQDKNVGIKGVGKCKYCPSTELVFSQMQTRSGDEPMTIFVRCTQCNKQWRQ
jgi:DNA-directed RNA polymerase subunit M/transcription elongation factor TFIIS